jgi:thermitase
MRSRIPIVILTILAAGAFIAQGVLGGSNVAGAAEDVTLTVTSHAVDAAEAAAAPASAITAADAVVQSVGVSPTAEQRLAVADRWGLERIDVAAAWDAAGSFAPVLVAVLDTGMDPDATCSARVKAAIDFTGEGSVLDEHGHGTHMADTIASIAPNADLLNLKVADKHGRCDSMTVAKAVRWAVDRGADVINMSLEVADSPELKAAVQHAWEHGAVVVVAAGNDGSTEPAFPAYYEQSIAVAGTNQSDGLAVLSNHGDWVDVAAPGFKIYAQTLDGAYDLETGTSPAAAHVSGVAALLCGIAVDADGNGMVNDEVRDAIEISASSTNASGAGCGIVNARLAVRYLAA